MTSPSVDLRESETDSADMPSRVLVVIPAYNEAQSIRNVIHDVRRNLPDAGVLVVDDGSQDDTLSICRRENVEVLALPFNLGVGGAMRVGFLYALRNSWDVVVQIDADGQHDPSFVPEMLKRLESGADVVVGARFAGVGTYVLPKSRRITMFLVSRLMSHVCRTELSDATSGLRVANRPAIRLFAHLYPAEYLGDTLQSLVIAKRAGLRIMQVPVNMRPRTHGEPSQGFVGSVLYLLRCGFAVAVKRQSPDERRWLSTQEEML